MDRSSPRGWKAKDMPASAKSSGKPESFVMTAPALPLSEQYLLRKRELAREMLNRSNLGKHTVRADWAATLVSDARERFLSMGAPIRRDEYWKYTDPDECTSPPPGLRAELPAQSFEKVEGLRISFGEAGLRFQGPMPDGLKIESLRDALSSDSHWSRQLLGKLEIEGQRPISRPLAVLNSALLDDGLIIRASLPIRTPVHLIRDVSPNGGISYGRVLVFADPGSSLVLLETDLSRSVHNSVTEAYVEAGGRFDHIRTQTGAGRLETTAVFVQLAARADFRGFTLTLDGQLTRNETVLTLSGESARGHIAGGVLARSGSVVDNTVLVTHAAEECESRQVFKSVLDDRARGVFQGKVLVRQAAQKTDGYQISQAVLLDGRAEFDSKPELEIYADDVKCSHGSTAGALDDTALFYLRTRGVQQREAESMLVQAFLEEAIEEIEHKDVASSIRKLSDAWMKRRQEAVAA